jgi:predicted phage replisome organizer
MNDTKIKIIRKMPDGDRVLILWLGVLCIGMKSGKPGILEIGDGIPFTPETLSSELDIPLQTVKFGLKTFHDLKMIEISRNETIFIKNFEKHQNLNKIEKERKKARKRVQNYRKRQRLLIDNVTRNDTVTNALDKIREDKKENRIIIDTDIEYYQKEWNSLASKYGLSEVVKMSKSRITKIRTRMKNDPHYTEHFKLCIEKIPESDFLLGRVPGKTWKVNFDYLIKNDEGYIKICENVYKGHNGKSKQQAEDEKINQYMEQKHGK